MGHTYDDTLPIIERSITWQRDISLLTNPLVIGGAAAILCVTLIILEGAVAFISFLFSDEPVLLPPQVLLVALGVLLVLFTLACLILGNRLHPRYILNARSAIQGSFQKTTTARRLPAGIAVVFGAWSALRLAVGKGSRQEQVVP